MKFESREQRDRWKILWMSLIPDASISFVMAVFVFNDISGFFVVLFCIWGFYLLTWVKAFIWSWVVFKTSARKNIAEKMFYYLKRHEFPEPLDSEDSAVGYFERVMCDDNLPGDLRVKAAFEFATLNGYDQRCEVIMSSRMSAACEDGIERYKMYFPSPR